MSDVTAHSRHGSANASEAHSGGPGECGEPKTGIIANAGAEKIYRTVPVAVQPFIVIGFLSVSFGFVARIRLHWPRAAQSNSFAIEYLGPRLQLHFSFSESYILAWLAPASLVRER